MTEGRSALAAAGAVDVRAHLLDALPGAFDHGVRAAEHDAELTAGAGDVAFMDHGVAVGLDEAIGEQLGVVGHGPARGGGGEVTFAHHMVNDAIVARGRDVDDLLGGDGLAAVASGYEDPVDREMCVHAEEGFVACIAC
jgi:hypothetical protein